MQTSRFIRAFLIAFVIAIPIGMVSASGTVTITASGTPAAIGDAGGVDYVEAQSILPLAGSITSFSFTLGSNTGSPSGAIIWSLRSDNSNNPGSQLCSGSIDSPLASSTNTVNGCNVYVPGTGIVWLVLSASDQPTNNYYGWQRSNANPYADGQRCWSSNAGSSYTCVSNDDMGMSITTSDPTPTPTTTPTTTPTATITATPTSSPTPNLSYYATLDLGDAYRIERTATFGDIAIVAVMLVLVMLITLLFIVWVLNARTNA